MKVSTQVRAGDAAAVSDPGLARTVLAIGELGVLTAQAFAFARGSLHDAIHAGSEARMDPLMSLSPYRR